MSKIIIAIDGFSSTGKSSTAKVVAKKLGYVYVDTGAMYRAVAYLAETEGFVSYSDVQNQENQSVENRFSIEKEALIKKLKESTLSFKHNPELGFSEIYLNGKNIEKEIRSIEIATIVSQIAKIPEIRSYLVDLQRDMGRDKGIVMDGRDIGTVVFPDAELKIFMTASEQIRAQRRYEELTQKGEKISFEQVLKNVQQRDFMDTTRKESPLKKADDAVEIDNSFMTFDQQVNQIIELSQSITDNN